MNGELFRLAAVLEWQNTIFLILTVIWLAALDATLRIAPLILLLWDALDRMLLSLEVQSGFLHFLSIIWRTPEKCEVLYLQNPALHTAPQDLSWT